MKNQREKFRELGRVLLSNETGPAELRAAVHELFDLLSHIVGYDDREVSGEQRSDTFLSAGKAISFQGAARCLWEFARTSKFLRGVAAAIRVAQQRFPGERIRLVEAGCGPFALLALPLATQFSSDELSFTLLDIHQHSLDAARQIVDALGLASYVVSYVRADASTWRCTEAQRPHVIVSETMQQGLRKEPQVTITRHLAPQLLPGGLFVPESIVLDFALLACPLSPDGVPQMRLQRHKELMNFSAETSNQMFAGEFVMPEEVTKGSRPSLCTTIRVFADIVLQDNECSLTLPIILRDLPTVPGARISYAYQVSAVPGMDFSVVTT
ncbi:MAG: hypothetical protein H6R15_67 [Proteobacteria bacterium]|nr:hypothetical protein [Pseudomonadota bacterium]